jgi:hypothetical protein
VSLLFLDSIDTLCEDECAIVRLTNPFIHAFARSFSSSRENIVGPGIFFISKKIARRRKNARRLAASMQKSAAMSSRRGARSFNGGFASRQNYRYGSKKPSGEVCGWKAVRLMASALKRLPKERRKWIASLWTHPHKKRVRLQRVGGSQSRGRGFVIDDRTIVDGITRRMGDLKCDASAQIAVDIASFYKKDARFLKSRKNAAAMDKKHSGCKNLSRSRNPMRHGSKVHVQIYHAVRYAVKISGLHRSKQPLPKKFNVDPCTSSCLIGMIKSGLYPFSSEWPVFTTQGTGIATSADILAIDTKCEYEPVFVEIKTGSATKAMDACIKKSWQTIGNNGCVSAVAQVALTRSIALECYSNVFSSTRSSACVVFARPWGIVRVEVPDEDECERLVGRLSRLILFRGKSLRANLSSNSNTQAHMTAANKPRKRKPKTYKVGFDSKK